MIYLNHKSIGQGPALIVLHGLFGSLDNWVSFARVLGQNYSVYLIDQRNHGKSPHMNAWDYPTMAEDLYDFMEQEGIRQAHILGHSMGGKVAMQFAAYYPEHLDRLIVADMAPIKYEPHHTEIIQALQGLDLSQFEDRQQADEALSQRIKEAGIRQFLLKSLARNRNQSFRWKFNLEVLGQKYEEVLEGVEVDPPFKGPSLFIYGEKSNYVVDQYRDLILSYFPSAEFQGIPGAGHWLHAEAPQEFLTIVKGFLKKSDL